MGKIVKPIGDLVGGITGGIIGAGGKQMAGGGLTGMQNSTGINTNFGQQIANRSGDVAGQTAALDQSLLASLRGEGPTVAGLQLQQGTDANIAQQSALAASARGGNVALSQRTAANNAAIVQQTAANQAGQLRAQEMNMAQQSMMANAGQKDAFTQGMSTLGINRDMGAATIEEKGKERSQKGSEAFSGMVGGGIGALAASDENDKTNIKDGANEIDHFLRAISAKSYEYKDSEKSRPEAGKGEFVSVMAQDLEKTKTGKSMVKNTDKGKVVDYGKGFGALLAAQARLNERLDEMEGKRA